MKSFLLSVDGLSTFDYEALIGMMPKCSAFLGSFDVHEIDHMFTSPQAVWGEILTGKPWYLNGCAGYSRPMHSLNELSVMGERDLLEPVSMLHSDGDPSVAINLPLVRPGGNRLWLSDGSLPINNLVSPSRLLSESTFAKYVPRPAASMAVHCLETDPVLVNECVAVESRRLECAQSLFLQESWSRFIYRVTLFDQLAHIVGLNYLRAKDLLFFPAIQEFVERLDDFIHLVAERADTKLAIVSGFSHVVCTGLLNLNTVLASGGFLELETEEEAFEKKVGRMNVMAVHMNSTPSPELLRSMEGCLVPNLTLAASPVSGCIFVNREETFADGCVMQSNYQQVCENGGAFKFEKRPAIKTSAALPVPEFIVEIDGVEFHNMREGSMKVNVTPRTTHAPKGFLSFQKRKGSAREKWRLSDICALVAGVQLEGSDTIDSSRTTRSHKSRQAKKGEENCIER
jgi:hypothetical protein